MDNITMEKAWQLLNKRGVHSIEEFEKVKKEVYLDVGIFTMPLKGIEEDK